MRTVVDLVLLLVTLPVAAQVYTCTSATGTRGFADRPCEAARPAPPRDVSTALVLAALNESPPRLEWPDTAGTVADGSSWQHLGYDHRGRRVGAWVAAGTATEQVFSRPSRSEHGHRRHR